MKRKTRFDKLFNILRKSNVMHFAFFVGVDLGNFDTICNKRRFVKY